VDGRVINALGPFAGHLRRLFVRTGGRRCKTELLGKSGRNLLVSCQLPRFSHRTTPLSCVRVLPVINDQS
jgi:hypothetical protein